MTPIKSIDDIKIGDKIRLYYGKGNFNNMLYHVRGVIDEEVFVLRYWRKHKYWEYKTEYKFTLDYWIQRNYLFKG